MLHDIPEPGEFIGTGQHEPSIQAMPPGQDPPFGQNVWTWYPSGHFWAEKDKYKMLHSYDSKQFTLLKSFPDIIYIKTLAVMTHAIFSA